LWSGAGGSAAQRASAPTEGGEGAYCGGSRTPCYLIGIEALCLHLYSALLCIKIKCAFNLLLMLLFTVHFLKGGDILRACTVNNAAKRNAHGQP